MIELQSVQLCSSNLSGADPRVLLLAGDVCQHEQLQAWSQRGRRRRQRCTASALGLKPARVRPDQPPGLGVGVRLVPDPPVDRSHLRIQAKR